MSATQPASDVLMGDETGTPAVGEKVVALGSAQPDNASAPAVMNIFDKQSGRLLWSCPVGEGLVSSGPYKRAESTITSSPVMVGRIVYFGASDGCVYAIDSESGSVVWKYRLGVPIASTVAITGNTLVLAAWDGTVYAFTSERMTGDQP